ncbi:Snf7-domain-containing protein [Mycena alexandri]|uniref:Snf7-domain-containing protein n=1 Tax=Mycena alexandri TaxID=1745969 RepID=A0AAD6XG80_9AGAR|nr:Snf7-domain-containing protein [Mycena alexandri]
MQTTTAKGLMALPPFSTTSPSRLQSIYSDISRQKHSNPTSYLANVEWWRTALEAIVRSGIQQDGSNLVLRADPNLMDVLRVSGVGKPLALSTVVTELRTQKSLFTRSDFLNSKEPVYDSGWLPGRIAAYVVGKPLWWALEQLGVVGEEGFISSARGSTKDTDWWGDYVVLSLVEAAANDVLKKQSDMAGGPGDALYSFEGFKMEFASTVSDAQAVLTDEDAKILIRFLERDRGAVVVDKDVIKFVEGSSGVREITAVDRGILELKDAVRRLHAQVSEFRGKIDHYTQEATAALQQKHKPVAMTYLRLRKQFEEVLRKRLGSLETLEGTLISVQTAAGDVEIIKSYESSTATLKTILKHPSLQKESIEKTMEAMAEANADAEEVNQLISINGNVALGIDFNEAELEEELKGLADEAAREEAAATEARLGHGDLKPPIAQPLPAEPERTLQGVIAF